MWRHIAVCSLQRKSAPFSTDTCALTSNNASQQPPCARPGDAMLPVSPGHRSTSTDPLVALPRPLVVAVLLLLPVDTRLRCSEVNRAWRALLADTALWRSLDLAVSCGLTRFSEALLRAAVVKASGQLRSLDLTGQHFSLFTAVDSAHPRLLLEPLAANAATLTELHIRTGRFWLLEEVRAVLEQAPALLLLEAGVTISRDDQVARAMLRNEPPFQALRLRRLWMSARLNTAAAVASFGSDLRCHASLQELCLSDAALDTVAAMSAVVDACIALRLGKLFLGDCLVAPATLPELARLIYAGALQNLCFQSTHNEDIFDGALEYTGLFVDALRASAMTKLQFFGLGAIPENVMAAAAFINARPQ